MLKIVHQFQNKRKIFNKLIDERFDEITKLDQNVNHNDLICRYKIKTLDEIFNTYNNALNCMDKIKNDKIKLSDVKNDQIKFKSNLGERKEGKNKLKEQKKHMIQY